MQTLALQSLVGESQEAEAATRQSRALWEPRGNTPKCQWPESAGDMVPREKKQNTATGRAQNKKYLKIVKVTNST